MQYPASTYDAEVSPNVAGVGFLDTGNGDIRQFTSMVGVGETFADLRRWWTKERGERIWIGFNSISYDNHILRAILRGEDDPAALYRLSLSRVDDDEDWLNRIERIDNEISVDLFSLLGGAKSKVGSLKEVGIKLGYKVLQELPYPPDQHLTEAEWRTVMAYNEHDLRITALAADACSEQIEQRLELSIEMGVWVVNRHDAGVAEAIMRHALFGSGKPDYPPNQKWHLSGRDLVKPFSYTHPALQDLLDRIAKWELDMYIVETPDD